MYLDTITPAQVSVGYGQLGTRGGLGYEGKQVRVQGRAYPHSLSTHPPARLLYQLGGRFAAFRCQVALNDDAAGQATHADFVVRADGRQVALVHVTAGEPPRDLAADLAGAQTLELAVRTTRWPWCHAVWLDPQLEEAAAAAPARVLVDCLGRAEIALPQARRCIVTVVFLAEVNERNQLPSDEQARVDEIAKGTGLAKGQKATAARIIVLEKGAAKKKSGAKAKDAAGSKTKSVKARKTFVFPHYNP